MRIFKQKFTETTEKVFTNLYSYLHSTSETILLGLFQYRCYIEVPGLCLKRHGSTFVQLSVCHILLTYPVAISGIRLDTGYLERPDYPPV